MSSPCNNIHAYSVPCEIDKPTVDFEMLIKNKYMTKEEVAIYKAAEQNGFDVNLKVDFDFRHDSITELFTIEIKKTKIK